MQTRLVSSLQTSVCLFLLAPPSLELLELGWPVSSWDLLVSIYRRAPEPGFNGVTGDPDSGSHA